VMLITSLLHKEDKDRGLLGNRVRGIHLVNPLIRKVERCARVVGENRSHQLTGRFEVLVRSGDHVALTIGQLTDLGRTGADAAVDTSTTRQQTGGFCAYKATFNTVILTEAYG